MFNFTSYMPAEIIFGRDCVLNNANKFAGSKKIFMVSGRASAKLSGALDDIINMAGEIKSELYIFDKIQENPLLSVCYEGGKAAYDFGADLILGVGGGSPLDAAKAIAMFAANPGLQPDGLFAPPYKNDPLPIYAVPTTAGTGSEANAYSVLTLDGKDVKKTFTYVKSLTTASNIFRSLNCLFNIFATGSSFTLLLVGFGLFFKVYFETKLYFFMILPIFPRDTRRPCLASSTFIFRVPNTERFL